jgi:hypothetical protein
VLVRDGLAAAAKLLHPTRDRGLSDRRDRHRPEHRIHVAGRRRCGSAMVAGWTPVRLSMWVVSHSVTVGTWRPVELDDAQRLIGTVVIQEGFETLCGREVLEGQRAPVVRVVVRLVVSVAQQASTRDRFHGCPADWSAFPNLGLRPIRCWAPASAGNPTSPTIRQDSGRVGPGCPLCTD